MAWDDTIQDEDFRSALQEFKAKMGAAETCASGY
jgi:hypothetical protein